MRARATAPEWLRAHVEAALEDDRARDDLTSALMISPGLEGEAVLRAGAPGILAGTLPATLAFRQLSPKLSARALLRDGSRLKRGTAVLRVRGPRARILSGERTALNYLMHLSGVATLTARYLAALRGTGVTLLDTRKTTPLMRVLEKMAVASGGGTNHRMGLHDAVLIKENHVRAAGSITAAVERIRAGLKRRGLPHVPIEIEVQSEREVREVASLPVNRVMLDNFSPARVKAAVRILREARPSVQIEVSGGIHLVTIRRFALPGVDFISVGALTHSAPALPLSMDWIK